MDWKEGCGEGKGKKEGCTNVGKERKRKGKKGERKEGETMLLKSSYAGRSYVWLRMPVQIDMVKNEYLTTSTYPEGRFSSLHSKVGTLGVGFSNSSLVPCLSGLSEIYLSWGQ